RQPEQLRVPPQRAVHDFADLEILAREIIHTANEDREGHRRARLRAREVLARQVARERAGGERLSVAEIRGDEDDRLARQERARGAREGTRGPGVRQPVCRRRRGARTAQRTWRRATLAGATRGARHYRTRVDLPSARCREPRAGGRRWPGPSSARRGDRAAQPP